MAQKMRTPWGTADSVRTAAPGILLVSTPGHGGVKLDRKHNAMVAECWRRKGGWYEEDCEWAIVALTFPDAFPGATDDATRTAKSYYPDEYTAVTGLPVATEESYVLRKRAAVAANAQSWVCISASGDWHANVPKGFVGVCATFGGRGEDWRTRGPERFFLVPSEEYKTAGEFGFVVDTARHQETDGNFLVKVAS